MNKILDYAWRPTFDSYMESILKNNKENVQKFREQN